MRSRLKPLKQPADIEPLLEKIKRTGIYIENEDIARKFLFQVSYYRFSAYLIPFKHRKQPNISFDKLCKIYDFDAELRCWVYAQIDVIELYVRTALGQYLANTHGAEAYLKESLYNADHRHHHFQKRLEKCIHDNNKSLAVSHHRNHYDGHFPIWVIIELFSTGMLSIMYADLKLGDQKAIAKKYFRTGVKQLKSWLRVLTDLRNKCAHYTRLYGWVFSANPSNFKGATWKMDNTLFSQIYVLAQLYPDNKQWNNRVEELSVVLQNYRSVIDLEQIGFPANWREILSH